MRPNFCLALLACSVLFPSALKADEQDIVLNEIMYHPPGDWEKLQFVELFNRGNSEVDLSNWSLKKGAKFTLPAGTKLASRSFLVVCHDLRVFAARYGQKVPTVGPFTGKLSHKGESLELCNAQGKVIDSVKYGDREPWPAGADGYSSSLERICPSAPAALPENWSASPWPVSKRAAGSPGRQNDSFATNLPPVISLVEFTPRTPSPGQGVKVLATVADEQAVKGVELLYRVATTGRQSEERALAMKRVSGDEKKGVYAASIDPQAQGQLVRFRIKAAAETGAERICPSAHEPRPAFSYFTYSNSVPARIPIGLVVNVSKPARGPERFEESAGRRGGASGMRGNGALLYVPADGGEPQTFDYLQIALRRGGYKIHFQKDRTLKGMATINLLFEGPPRWVLAEPLSYALYRMAGVPAELSEHMRLTMDGRLLGFHLLVEQPNKAFLARNGRDDTGNLYKLLWYGNGVVGQHEKKTNPNSDHSDIIQVIDGLRRKSGPDQWAFIQQNFNVDEFASYYAVNMCVQNWDGFFNNYFTYHDTGKTGKWEIYPWDEDKTWGDYDGASSKYNWYSMPLTYGMAGDKSPRDFMSFGTGPFGGVSWWRPAGFFSGPLLANPEFRKRFLARLHELCTTVFTEENFIPIIDAMEKRLEPEVRLRAQRMAQDPNREAREFASLMQSFRNQVKHRREFIMKELAKAQ